MASAPSPAAEMAALWADASAMPEPSTRRAVDVGVDHHAAFFASDTDLHAFMTQSQVPPHPHGHGHGHSHSDAGHNASDELPPLHAGATFLEELLGDGHDHEEDEQADEDEDEDGDGDGDGDGEAGIAEELRHGCLGPAPLSSATAPPLALPPLRRHAQLEDNYERKKKRAKINRRDVNARFQELMTLLQLREDRKLNRAKVLEHAIARIHALTTQVRELQALQCTGSGSTSTTGTGACPHPAPVSSARGWTQPQPQPKSQPQPQPQPQSLSPVLWMPVAVSSTAPTRLPLMPLQPQSTTAVKSRPHRRRLGACATPASTSISASHRTKRGRDHASTLLASTPSARARPRLAPATATATPTSTPTATPTATAAAAVTATTANALSPTDTLLWAAFEVPTVLSFCDAWTLTAVTSSCRRFRSLDRMRSHALWRSLCLHRWGHPDATTTATATATNPRDQWLAWHAANKMPVWTTRATPWLAVASTTESNSGHSRPHAWPVLAAGRQHGIALWTLLVPRSNGRTTRTVLVDGRAVARQIVELAVVVHNLHAAAPVQLVPSSLVLAIRTTHGDGAVCVATASAQRSHLPPPCIVAQNGVAVEDGLVDEQQEPPSTRLLLRHGDCVMLRAFVECPGLDLESEVLQRVAGISLSCRLWTRSTTQASGKRFVDVRAAAPPRPRPLQPPSSTLQGQVPSLPTTWTVSDMGPAAPLAIASATAATATASTSSLSTDWKL